MPLRRRWLQPLCLALGLLAWLGTAASGLGPSLGADARAASRRRRPTASGAPLSFLDRTNLSALLAEVHHRPYLERIAYLAHLFLGTPYLLDPLGEGPGADVDDDPLVDLGHVDCQTFVEQVIALASASNADEFERRLLQIRYRDATVTYTARYHLMGLGWIPGNVRSGFIRDLTREIGGNVTATVEKRIDRREWRGKFARLYRRLGKTAPKGVERLDYVPLDRVMAVADKLPRVSIAYVVATPQRGVPFVVTHMGFVLREPDGRVIFRHASAHPDNRSVVDVPLAEYLRFLGRREQRRKRPVLGLSFSGLREPTPPVRLSSTR